MQRAYFRILGQHVVECAKDGCAAAHEGQERAAAASGSGDTLDLSPSGREFMTKELAEQMLQPMLAEGVSTLFCTPLADGLPSSAPTATVIDSCASVR